MNILAYDTSSQACSVALKITNKIYSHHEIQPKHQNQIILELIHDLFEQAQISLADLNAIAFGQGPGSFTGIRLASAVTQGLVLAPKIPVLGLSSLKILAQAAYQKHDTKNILVCVDAKMDEFYFAHYQCQNDTLQLIGKEFCGKMVALKPDPKLKYVGVGDGWQLFQEMTLKTNFPQLTIDNELVCPNAVDMFELARIPIMEENFIPIEKIQPNYLRELQYKKQV